MISEAHEKLGQLVEAREVLLQLVHEKISVDAPEVFANAQAEGNTRLSALDPRVPRLVIELAVTQAGKTIDPNNAQIFLGDESVPTSALDVPYPVNPGKYQASAQV